MRALRRFTVRAKLPEPLAALSELVLNLRWSWHPETRPAEIDVEPNTRWTRLEILGKTGGGLLHAEGTVEFRAHYRERGHTDFLREDSRFVRNDGTWVYFGPL